MNLEAEQTTTKTVKVEVQADHLERLVGSRKPLLALAELVWNSLDADANNIQIELTENVLGAIEQITVIDDGHGISYIDATNGFQKLGGSWKKAGGRSRTAARLLHGKSGQGRFKAFGLGRNVRWTSRYQEDAHPLEFNILGSADELGTFRITDPVKSSDAKSSGTSVIVRGIEKSLGSLSKTDASEEFGQLFALYLRDYPTIRISYDGILVDPSTQTRSVTKFHLEPFVSSDGENYIAELEIIEWLRPVERALVLCDADGFALAKQPAGIQAPGFSFTAYIKSNLIRHLDRTGSLALDELHPDLRGLLDAARNGMRDHFRKRAADEAATVVDKWKRDKVYPFDGPPKSIIETTERQVFDVVALNLHAHLPNFEQADSKSKRLSFSLLKSAIERSPDSVQKILQDVLQLPKEKQEELAELLTHTSLSAIINAAKLVADRLEFLRALEILVFDLKKETLERRQLHRILAQQTWIFGEEFNLSVDDQSLTEVLRKHLELQGRAEPIDLAPVTTPDGQKAIVDLMLSRLVPQNRAIEREHLIVELKRPSQKIDLKAAAQIEEYAASVVNDERFRDTKTRWTFWAISNEMDQVVRNRASQRHMPKGMLLDNAEFNYVIWIKTWGELLEDCRSRLTLFQEQLEYSVTRDSALDYLRRTHASYLPDSIRTNAPVTDD